METDKRQRPQSKPLTFRTTFSNTIHTALLSRGWRETEGDDWDLHWCEKDWMSLSAAAGGEGGGGFDGKVLATWQRVNHFRNFRELCRKDLLVKNLKRYKRLLTKNETVALDDRRTLPSLHSSAANSASASASATASNNNDKPAEGRKAYTPTKPENPDDSKAYSFWPLTYVLPGDYALFVEEFKRNPTSLWIMKPVGRAQGKGIFLFTHLKQISKWKSDSRYDNTNKNAETYVVQRYISNPFLVAGKKFDMRLYCLVTSYSPLTVWMHRSGFCRFSSTRYSSNTSTMSDTTMHLTNVAIQKKSDAYDKETGGKWSIRDLKLFLMNMYGVGVVDKLFYDMHMTMLKCLFAVKDVMMNDKHCFELYGFDILFDDTFKVYVIEVNASPSMSANTKEDSKLKVEMLTNVFDILDLEGKLKGDEVKVGGFDLVHKGGMVGGNGGKGMYSTNLGADWKAGENTSGPAVVVENKEKEKGKKERDKVKGNNGKASECHDKASHDKARKPAVSRLSGGGGGGLGGRRTTK